MPSSPVYFSIPSASLYQFPPRNDPLPLPPPPPRSSLSAPPFEIPLSLYRSVLDVRVPITIACLYAVTVTSLNRYNKSRGNKPWRISRTRAFYWFVVAHNVLLAVYSAWTFVGMWGALRRTVQNPTGPSGVVATVDSLCKVHGISGLGNAVTYNPDLAGWVSESPARVHLSEMGTPDPTDLGRLWNEGLAFYGWFFYLSKFYEVLDTAIILAKGKKSSTLQTYHHAGAMMCMWAGIRFMSAPIWVFTFVNSGIHALMYTYYTLTAFAVPIPQALKRSLTTMQILQFVIGASYAAIHLFVTYTVPIQVPDVTASVASVASAASTVVSAAAASATSAGVADLVKKYLFRAAGEEGLAENVNAPSAAPRAVPQSVAPGQQQYRTEYQTVPCINTSGQTFAIWLNVLYLAPLTVLFVRFFIRSYIKRTSGKGANYPAQANAAEKAGMDAIKGVERELYPNGAANGHANGTAKARMNGTH